MADATNYIDVLGREKLEWAPVRLVGSDGLCRELLARRYYYIAGVYSYVNSSQTNFFPIVNFTQEERTVPYEEIIYGNSSEGTEQLPQNIYRKLTEEGKLKEKQKWAGFKKMRTVKVGVLYVNKRKAEESDYTDGTAEHPFRYFWGALETAYIWNSMLFALPFDYILIHVVDTVNEFIETTEVHKNSFLYSKATTLIEGEEGTLTFALPTTTNSASYFRFSNLSFISCSFSFKESITAQSAPLGCTMERRVALLAFAGKDKLYQLRNGKLSELSNISVSDNNFLIGYYYNNYRGYYNYLLYKDNGICYAIGDLHSPPLLDPDSLADNLTPLSFTTEKIKYGENSYMILQKQEWKGFTLYKEPSGRCYLTDDLAKKSSNQNYLEYTKYDFGDSEIISWCVFYDFHTSLTGYRHSSFSNDLFLYLCKIDFSYIDSSSLIYYFLADSVLSGTRENDFYSLLRCYDSNVKFKVLGVSFFANNCVSDITANYPSILCIKGQLTLQSNQKSRWYIDIETSIDDSFLIEDTELFDSYFSVFFDGCSGTICIENADIYVYDSSLSITKSYFHLYLFDSSTATIENCSDSFTVNTYNSSTAIIENCSYSFTVNTYNSSTATIENCSPNEDKYIKYNIINALDNSLIYIHKSSVSIDTSNNSCVTVENSIVKDARNSHATLNIKNCKFSGSYLNTFYQGRTNIESCSSETHFHFSASDNSIVGCNAVSSEMKLYFSASDNSGIGCNAVSSEMKLYFSASDNSGIDCNAVSSCDISLDADNGSNVSGTFSASEDFDADADNGSTIICNNIIFCDSISLDADNGSNVSGTFSASTDFDADADNGSTVACNNIISDNISLDAVNGSNVSGTFSASEDISLNAGNEGNVSGTFSASEHISLNAEIEGIVSGTFSAYVIVGYANNGGIVSGTFSASATLYLYAHFGSTINCDVSSPENITLIADYHCTVNCEVSTPKDIYLEAYLVSTISGGGSYRGVHKKKDESSQIIGFGDDDE